MLGSQSTVSGGHWGAASALPHRLEVVEGWGDGLPHFLVRDLFSDCEMGWEPPQIGWAGSRLPWGPVPRCQALALGISRLLPRMMWKTHLQS